MTEARPLHPPLEAESWPVRRLWRRLDDLCKGVFDCPHSTPKLAVIGPFVARSQDVRTGMFRTDEAARVTEVIYQERIARAEPRHGDLLYSREGTYFGIAAEVPRDTRVCLGQRMVLIRPDEQQLNSRFLRLWLNSDILARYLHGFRDGSVAERLNMPTIRGLPVPVFPRTEQDAIAALLGALDDKIELNRRMSETLETIAQAIFKDWFVEFGPSRAKIEGRQPYLSGDLWTLFPPTLDGNDEPVGWTHSALSDLVNQHKSTLVPTDFPDEIFAHHSIPAFDQGRTPAMDRGETIKSNKTCVPDGSILLSKLNPEIPRVWIPLDGSPGRKIASTEFLVFRPTARLGLSFLYALFCDRVFRERLEGMVTGTSKSHQRVQPKALLGLDLVIPPEPVAEAFEAEVWPLLDRSLKNRVESLTLSQLRNLLLPKLISGEIRLREAEKIVEAAA